MAAAARNDDSERAAAEVSRRLTVLQNSCQSPRSLEQNLSRVVREASGLAAAVQSYRRIALPAAGHAAAEMLQDINDHIEAFQEHAEYRNDHRDSEHLLGRIELAKELRAAIRKMAVYFDYI
jgi:hypothetical protein